jgi:hypothetical protein
MLKKADIAWDCKLRGARRRWVSRFWPVLPEVGILQVFNPQSSLRDGHYLCVHFPALNSQLADCDGQFESPWPRAAGIEIKHALAHLLAGNVAVAGDDGGKPRGGRLQIELREIMQYINRDAAGLENLRFGQLARPCALIDVAANGRHGSDGFELVKNFGRAHIPGMNDVIRSAQRCERLGTK